MPNVRVHFATNRNFLRNDALRVFGKSFNPDGVAALRFGYADFGDGARPTAIEVYPDKASQGDDAVLGSDLFLRELHVVMAQGSIDTLIFVHGFNVSFIEALKAGAELSRQIRVEGRPLNVVVFSWPSDGALVPNMSYYCDREDDDTFEYDCKLRQLPNIGRQVTVYHNPNDRALLISDTTKAKPDRLGSDGPRLIDHLPKKVVIVDCRAIAMVDRLAQHTYYINSPVLSRDIALVMEGQEPEAIATRTYSATRRAWRVNADL